MERTPLDLSELRATLSPGTVSDSWIDRLAVARDASLYRLVPEAIVRPTSLEDVRLVFDWCHRNALHCTFRAAGTSLSGQAVGDGILVDVSRHWNSATILDDGARIRLQPGVRGGHANALLRPYGRKLGPDPASMQACMIGGIVANNASGMCCGTQYNTYHTMHSLGMLLPNGLYLDTANPTSDDQLRDRAPDIHAGLLQLRDEIRSSPSLVDRISTKYRIKNNIGYSLNSFLDFDKPIDILAHLLVGSEGTLGFIEHIVYNTIPDARTKHTAIFLFPSIHDACGTVPYWTSCGAAAVEIMDDRSLESVAHLANTPPLLASVGKGAAALLVEFHDVAPPNGEGHALRWTGWTTDVTEQARLWAVRKGLMPTVGAQRKAGHTMINEDIAVPPSHLADLLANLRSLFVQHSYDDAVIFGHAKDGNLHFVLTLDSNNAAEFERFERCMADVARLVVERYDGSLKAEHGTGRNMAPFVEFEWGEQATSIMWRVKQLLDPSGILNPDVVLSRNPHIHTQNIKPVPVIAEVVNQCIECGFCEHICPSRGLTRTPRQRIALQRELAMSSLPDEARADVLRSWDYDVLDTCATDGLCSVMCPVGIDTGSYVKAERAKRGSRLHHASALIAAKHFRLVSAAATNVLAAIHAVSTVFGAKRFSRLSTTLHRILPVLPIWHSNTLPPAMPRHCDVVADPDVILLRSCGSRWFGGVDDATSLLEQLLQMAGVRYAVVSDGSICCGQVFGSKGHEDAENLCVTATKNVLASWQTMNAPIIVDASTCASALRHHLQEGDRIVLDIVQGMQEFVLPRLPLRKLSGTAVLHPGCGLVKGGTAELATQIAQRCVQNVVVPHDAGCCGMAGDRGLFHPDLVTSALSGEVQEIRRVDAQWYLSCNPSCESALRQESGRPFTSLVELVLAAARAARPLTRQQAER